MFALILMIIFSLGVALFATQNTHGTTITLANFPVDVPLFMIVIGSLLLGILISWLIHLTDAISTSLTLHGKEKAINHKEAAIADLKSRVHSLELENAHLRGENNEPAAKDWVEPVHRPSFFHRLRQSF